MTTSPGPGPGPRVHRALARELSDDVPELRVSPFLAPETGPAAARLAALGVPRRARAGDVVTRQGEVAGSMYLVVSGRLRLAMIRPDGGERVLAYVEPGASTGESGCVDRVPRSVTARAVVDSELLVVGRDDVLAAARHDPEILLEVARRIAHKQRLLHLHLAIDALPARDRMVLLVSHLADAHGEAGPDATVRLRLQLGVDDLAAIVGLTRVTASRELSRMVAEGVLLKRGRHLVVRDLPALRRLTSAVAV